MSDRSIRSLALAYFRHRGATVAPLAEDGSAYAIKRGDEATLRVAFAPEAPAELPLFSNSSPEWRAMVDDLTSEVAISYRYLVAGAIDRPAAALQQALPEGWAVAHAELLGVTQRGALAVSHRVRFDAPALSAATERLVHHVWNLSDGERLPELEAVWLDRPTLLIRPEAQPATERVEALVAEGAGLADHLADEAGASLEAELAVAHEEAVARAEAYFEQQMSKVIGREKLLSAKLDGIVAKLSEVRQPETIARLRADGAEVEAQLREAAQRREAELNGLKAALEAKRIELADAHELEAEVALVALAHLRDDRLAYRAKLVSPSGATMDMELGFWPVVGRLELPTCASCGQDGPSALLERGPGLVGCPACVEQPLKGSKPCACCQHPEPVASLVACVACNAGTCAGCAVGCAGCGAVACESHAVIVGGVGYCLACDPARPSAFASPAIAWAPQPEAMGHPALSLTPPRARPMAAWPTTAEAADAAPERPAPRRLAEIEAAILAAAPVAPAASGRRPLPEELHSASWAKPEASVRRLQTELPGVVPAQAWPKGTDELPALEAALAQASPEVSATIASLSPVAEASAPRAQSAELPNIAPEASTRRPLTAELPSIAPEVSTRRPLTAELPSLAPEASTRRPLTAELPSIAPEASTRRPLTAELPSVAPEASTRRPMTAELPSVAPEASARRVWPEAKAEAAPHAEAPQASALPEAPEHAPRHAPGELLQAPPPARRLSPDGSARGLYDEVDLGAWPDLASVLAANTESTKAQEAAARPPMPYRPVAADDCPSCGQTAPAQAMVQCLTCGVAVCTSCHQQAEDGCPACARLDDVAATDPWLVPVLQVSPELVGKRRSWSLARLGPYVVAHWKRWGAWGMVTVLLGKDGHERVVSLEVSRSAAAWQAITGQG